MSHFDLDYSVPAPRQLPLEIAADTFVIRALTHSIGGTWTNLNSMVVLGPEPLLVDTGMVTDRVIWFEDVFSLVAPEAVRWIFVTHIDCDHAGNLIEALERCPNARVITSHGESFRLSAAYDVPAERMWKLDNGECFELSGREFQAIRPPVYDSPYTRGLLDHATGVYYASDAFCAPMPVEPVDRVDQISSEIWADSMAKFHHASLCPWVSLVDPARFQAEVSKLASLGITMIAGAHTPLIAASSLAQAFTQMAQLCSWKPRPSTLAAAAS